MTGQLALWVGFNVVVLAVLALDLGLSRRALTLGEAAVWTLAWLSLSLAFCAGLWMERGQVAGLQFLTGYLIEYALSVDNLFVFLLVFQSFRVGPRMQRRLLSYGVLGAVVLRAGLIVGGVALVHRFEWVLYLFGGFLLLTAGRMLVSGEAHTPSPGESRLLRLARRMLPMARGEAHEALVVREEGALRFTPLFLVLLVVESTDLLFALDSIPAVVGISRDSFIVYASNVCAVLGLRSLYFLLAALMGRLRYLKPALAAILALVGGKMVYETASGRQVGIGWALGAVGALLLLAVLASWARPAATEG